MMKYKIVKENTECYSIYRRRLLFFWSYVVMKPSFALAKRHLYEIGCRAFLYVE